MIPIQSDGWTRERYVQNVIECYESATKEQREEGEWWYPHAHSLASFLADGDVRTGAGLLAALSPQTPWDLNVQLASEAYEAGDAHGHIADALSKCNRILAGEDPEDVLPMRRKTGHFYRCIVDPTDPEAVCVDRHAHDIAVGVPYGNATRGLSAHGRYALIAHCYREAAYRLGVLPQVVQAVTWVAWRAQISGTSTRGNLAGRA